jgi:hypothetical protein
MVDNIGHRLVATTTIVAIFSRDHR